MMGNIKMLLFILLTAAVVYALLIFLPTDGVS